MFQQGVQVKPESPAPEEEEEDEWTPLTRSQSRIKSTWRSSSTVLIDVWAVRMHTVLTPSCESLTRP